MTSRDEPPASAETAEAKVEVVDDVEDTRAGITEPGKLLRIALMLRELQEEVRQAEVDTAGRERLKVVYDRAVGELRSGLTGGLQTELDTLALPLGNGIPTESEIRVAQAQLIGWLEGLFQGIQAALMNQQLAARQQLEQMRQQRQLPPGARPEPPPQGQPRRPPGQYL